VDFKREGIIGASKSLRECLDLLTQAALCDASILITGETGTGKELFARAVHLVSERRAKKCIVVDCAAMPDNLIEGLLFGHEKGAFTSADQSREGLILQANGGTLFLDEIGEMPLTLQKVFLRVLQERRFRPIGSSRELESDFRLVAATNCNLQQMVKDGTFRSDLLFRMSTFVVELPALRERSDDIPLLARHHADRICSQYHVAPKDFSPEFIQMLSSYRWPGNVRELVNTLERTIAVARNEPVLFPKHLPMQIRIEVTRQSLQKEQPGTDTNMVHLESLPQLSDYRDAIYLQAEQKYLHDLMQTAENNIAKACEISGLSTSRLYALLKKQGIPLQR
jgi:two-component system NtrC family response regulator